MGAGPKRLGVVWPDTDEDLSRFEMAQADLLNRKLGSDRLVFDVACSKCRPGHSIDALYDVGDVEGIAAAAVSLAKRGADAVVWACTSGSFVGGLQWCLDQRAELRARTGLPVTSGTLALISSCLRLGYRSVDVLSPYPRDVSEIFLGCLGDAGLEVAGSRMLHSENALASADLRLMDECRAFADEGGLTGDVVMIPDTAVNSLWLIPGLEAVLGKPVLTVNQACLHEGAVLLDRTEVLTGREPFSRYRRESGEQVFPPPDFELSKYFNMLREKRSGQFTNDENVTN